jgi:hypothetical protein
LSGIFLQDALNEILLEAYDGVCWVLDAKATKCNVS